MNVLMLTPQVFGPGQRGGGERYVTELARALKDIVDVQLVRVPSYLKFQNLSSKDATESETALDIRLRDLHEMARWADVIHVHQWASPAFDVAYALAKIARKPLVLTDHGGGFPSVGRLLGKCRLKMVDSLALVSEASGKDLGANPEAVTVIWGGGDHVLNGSQGLNQYENVDFCFVGRILPHKGVHVAVAALPAGSKLRVCGEFRDMDYKRYVESLPCAGEVEYLGPVEDKDLASVYASAKYTLVPSVYNFAGRSYERAELLGLVALESLCAGTPVIGSDVAGLGELLRWSEQQYLPDGDVEAWNSALNSAMKAPVTKGHDLATRWADVASRCVVVYQKLAERMK